MKHQEHHIVLAVKKEKRYRETLISLANGEFRSSQPDEKIRTFAREAGIAVRFDPIEHPYDKKKMDYLVTFHLIEATPRGLFETE